MTTNDRRKTFATPLEFWRWAIQFPSKRRARATSTSHDVTIAISEHGFPYLSGGVMTRDNVMVPLIATHDEHGMIEEPERHPKTMLSEVANWLEDIAVCKDEGDRLGASKQAAKFIQLLIREEIAAATVEMSREDYGKPITWGAVNFYRLKPKGSS